jgi:hypothetical protein
MMHDIGRTQAEAWEANPLEAEFETFGETFGEMEGETVGETFEAGLHGHELEHEGWQETATQEMSHEGMLSEAEEMELAAELLEVTNEAELDHFLGKLVRRAWKGLKKVGARVAGPLGGILKSAAKVALPALGTAIGGPIGGKLASAAGDMFGLELEGLSAEDQEFEVSRRFVRFACAAARRAAKAPPHVDPANAAQAAVASAAQDFAPGMAQSEVARPSRNGAPAHGQAPAGARRQGTWVRRGRRIILLGV